MKKIMFSIFILLFGILLMGCENIEFGNEEDKNKEYQGIEITKMTYITIDYNGGYTEKRVLDFLENKYYSAGFLPDEEVPLEVKKTFKDEEEKVLIDACYVNGLFDLEEKYEESGIIDGGGWHLIIEFADGTTKISDGDNAGPSKIFNKCATYFYDLCGEVVMGILPEYYIYPPGISYGFEYSYDNHIVSNNSFSRVVRASYKWNKNKIEKDLYLLNENNKDKNEFITAYDYKLVLFTSNYNYDKKFNKITVKKYDYNSELTSEEVIYSGKWFKQIDLDLEFNKIYVYELSYDNGDYVQYTFNTYVNE